MVIIGLAGPACAEPRSDGIVQSTVPIAHQVQTILRLLDLIPDLAHSVPPLRAQAVCLALGLYHEARGQSANERIAVAQVVFNRMTESGDSICGTLWAHSGRYFQWVKRPVSQILPHEGAVWASLQHLALALIAHRPADITHGATYFYNPKLCAPAWADTGTVTARFENVFLRLDPKSPHSHDTRGASASHGRK